MFGFHSPSSCFVYTLQRGQYKVGRTLNLYHKQTPKLILGFKILEFL